MNPTNQGNINTQTRKGDSTEVEVVETEAEVKTFIKIYLPFVGGARAMLLKKKPNIEFRIVPYTKNAGELVEDTPNQFKHHHS